MRFNACGFQSGYADLQLNSFALVTEGSGNITVTLLVPYMAMYLA